MVRCLSISALNFRIHFRIDTPKEPFVGGDGAWQDPAMRWIDPNWFSVLLSVIGGSGLIGAISAYRRWRTQKAKDLITHWSSIGFRTWILTIRWRSPDFLTGQLKVELKATDKTDCRLRDVGSHPENWRNTFLPGKFQKVYWTAILSPIPGDDFIYEAKAWVYAENGGGEMTLRFSDSYRHLLERNIHIPEG